uniref:SHSP domain-containing protein n=1 Tax=Angiostrongylus costaricensis TaxID=334426 RepID=A0A0R3PD47_ANGCS
LQSNSERSIDDDKKFAVSIDVSHFKPEELKVNLDGKVLTVEGKQECKNDNSYMQNYGFRSFVRSWTLPNDVDTDAIQTELNDQGKLTIEAPKNGATRWYFFSFRAVF